VSVIKIFIVPAKVFSADMSSPEAHVCVCGCVCLCERVRE